MPTLTPPRTPPRTPSHTPEATAHRLTHDDLPRDRDTPPGAREALSALAPPRPVIADPGHPEPQGPPGANQPESPHTVPAHTPDHAEPMDDRDRPDDAPDYLPDTGEDEREEHQNTPPPPGYSEGTSTGAATSVAVLPSRTEPREPAESDDGTRIRQLDPLPEGEGPRLIALMNQKGGVGKTTTAANVAAALAEGGLNVLAIDLDPQAHLTLSLGVEPDDIEVSMYDLLTDEDLSAIEIVQEVGRPNRRGKRLGLLPAETNLAGAETELADRIATGTAQTVLRNKVRDLASHFDYVVMDCPPSLGLLTINALTLAREVIVPMQAHFLALQGLSKLLETVGRVREGINPSLSVAGIVLCMHEANTILAGEVINDLNGFLDEARGTDAPWRDAVVYDPPIRRNIKLAEAPSFGKSIFHYAADSNGAADYRKLARAIHAHRPVAARS